MSVYYRLAHLSPLINKTQSNWAFNQQSAHFLTRLFIGADQVSGWHTVIKLDLHWWLYVISDMMIWAAYLAIPFFIYQLIKKRPDLPFRRMFYLTAAFIVLCGIDLFIDALIFWWPVYWLSTLFRFITGIVSVFTVYTLFKIFPQVQSLRTSDELQREVDQREAIAAKLAESEFLLSEAVKLGKVGSWERDMRTDKIAWSAPVYEIYGLPYNKPVNLADALRVFPEPYRAMLDTATEKLITEGAKYDLELAVTLPGGRSKWVRKYGEPLYNQDGELIKIKGIVTDIDRYKSSEINLNRSLELLTRQNQQLKNFTHILSHNIRNHASNISLLLSFIDPETLDAEYADIVTKISTVANGLNLTLNDLSDAIKIRESVLVSEELDLKKITDDVLGILQSDIQLNKVEVELDFEVSTVSFPRIYLQSILMNLISNSIKYRRMDEDPLICLRTYRDENGKKVLECIDNGIGIDMELHGSKIFGLYKTFHDRKDAHGVGLFLIKNQVESQGAQISVYSSPGLGTTFKITFNE